jgi:cobyrinic acid a,c-diamide synthase
VQDALGTDLGAAGLRRDQVAGSYMHLIDLAGAAA